MTLEYSKELMKHFKNPKFVNDVKGANGIGEVGNVACGDIMHLEIRVDPKTEKIKDIGFKTFGCAAAIATSDVVCEIAKGKSISDARKIKKDDIIKRLNGMPNIKIHCSLLGIEALKKAIDNYKERKNGK